MPAPLWYNQRTREDLKREIANVISNDIRDPRVPMLITITDLKLSPDTRNATVSVSFFETEENRYTPANVEAALNHAAPFIQRKVAEVISIKHFPKFLFKYDGGMDHSRHISDLLDGMKDELAAD